MPVIQGGGITYDRSAGTRENIALLQQALQNAQTNKYNRGVLALNTASQAMDMLSKEIERSGMPASVFMSRGLGNAYLDTAMQGLSVASNRTLTGDEARAAVNKLVTVAYNFDTLPVKDRLPFLASLVGVDTGSKEKPTTEVQPETKPEPKIPFQKAAEVLTNRDRLGTTRPFGGNEATGGYAGTQGLGGTAPFGGNEPTGGYAGTLGATQGVVDGQTFGGFQGGGGPLNETVNFGAQQALPPMTGISMPPGTTGQGPSPTLGAQKPTPQTDLQQIIEWAKIGQAVVQQAQRPQPPTTGSEDLQAQPQPQAPQQAYPPMTGTYDPTAPQVAQAEAIPAAAAGPQLAQPPMTGTYGPAGPVGQRVGATQGTPLSAPQGNLEQLLQLAQIGKQYVQAQAQQAPQPTGAAPRVLPSEQQMAQRQAMSEGQAGVQMAPQTQVSTAPAEIDRWNQEDDYSRAVREFIKSLGGDWDDLPPATVRSMAHTATIFDSDRTVEQEVRDRMNYQRQMEDLPTLNGQEGLFNLFMPMSKAQDQGYQEFEQGLLAKGQRVAQATPTGGVVSANDKSFAKLVGSTNPEEAKAKYPGLYKLYEEKGLNYVKDRWQSYLNSNGLTQIPGGMFLDAASGTPVEGPDDSTFVEDFTKVLKPKDITTVVQATIDAVKKGTVPAKTVSQAAGNKVAADTAAKVAKASSMDKLFYANVPSVNDVPVPGPNWLERNAPKVVKAMDEFRSVLGEPTTSFKSQSVAYRAGKEAGSFLNAVWNKMSPEEKADYMNTLMEHARSADLTETFFTYGKDLAEAKLTEMGYQAQMNMAAAESQTAQAKMLGDMMTAASKNIGDALNSMSDFVAAVIPQATAKNTTPDKYIYDNVTLSNLYNSYKKFLAGLAENSGMNLAFNEIYKVQKKGWFGTTKYELTEENPMAGKFDASKLSPEVSNIAKQFGLL